MLQKVVALAIPGLAPFEFGVLCEVFGIDRTAMGGPHFDFRVLTADPGRVPTSQGFDLVVDDDLSAAASADLIAVSARSIGPVDERYLEVIRAAEARGAWVLSVCSGAFVLGESGILDGRRSATHWMHADEMQRTYPRTAVDPDVLFVEDRRVITSAGTAAGIDACLHLVRARLGAEAANQVARSLVIAPHREGGQAQYRERPVPSRSTDDPISRLLEWALGHLAEPLTIDLLAAQAHLSRRTFVRSFRAATGTTPAAWIRARRLDAARRLLETTDLSIEQVAADCGFGNAVTLRQNFAAAFSTTPTEYRRRFDVRAEKAP